MTQSARRSFVVVLGFASACGGPATEGGGAADPDPDPDPVLLGIRYDTEPDFRRNALVESLVNPENGYSKLRLERYTEDAWGALPEWNPRVSAVEVGQRAAPEPSSAAWRALDVDSVPWEEEALVELGREAFRNYPAQLAAFLQHVIDAPDSASGYGLSVDGERLGDAVWTELPRNLVQPAVTCSTCHAVVESGVFVPGKNAADFDFERIAADFARGAPVAPRPGLLDVTGDGVDNPTAIADLRAVRSQAHLQRAATVRNGLVSLAIRTETLLVTSLGESARPPRKVSFALALYLWSLTPVPVGAPGPASKRGETVFRDRCSSCHRPPEFTGPAVALEVVGTDRAVGDSPERGTGTYRVPSLRGIGDRRRLTASGTVADLDDMLDPLRTAKGHPYGQDLDVAEKADLVLYLRTL